MNRFFLAAIFMSIHCACAIEIRVPDGWAQVEVPSAAVPYKMPPTIRPMIRLLPPNKDGAASIAEMRVDVSLDEAAKSYARGMPMRGYTIESTAKVVHSGHEGRHIKGHMSLAGSPNTTPVEVYIIITPECILSIEVVGTKATSMINDVLSWIAFKPVKGPSKK
jgi:hypothetical protein